MTTSGQVDHTWGIRPNIVFLTLFLVCLQSPFGAMADENRVNFNRDIRPILSDRCFHCHGPDENERKGKLRLDVAEGKDGAYRTIDGITSIKPGNLDDSEFWYRITTDDKDDVMPPADSHKPALTDKEKALFKKWIQQGAEYEAFWAFMPPHATQDQKKPLADRIDTLIEDRLREEDLKPNPIADKRTLIRRLSLDLIGMPPSQADIKQFLNDKSKNAFESMVDRLLADPRHGEHMARYWLDLVRFADTNGIHHDHYRDHSPYRSWVIRAMNDNLPYDEFVRYQIAGDLYSNPTNDQLIASGFNRLHLIIDVGTALPEESYTRNVVDRVNAVGTAFMGLTLGCAMCHDHRYDPITQKDYFQLFAFFNNFDGKPETGRRGGFDFKRGLQPPYIFVGTPKQQAQLAEFNAMNKRRGELMQQAKRAKPEKKKKLQTQINQLNKKLKPLEAANKKLLETLPAAMVMRERKDIKPAFILQRGQYDQPGERVERGTPAFLPAMKWQKSKEKPQADRMDLAEWLVDPDNPLTARVHVNRIWQQIFGVGIVKTSEDFGAQGEWPMHPELLDELALTFVKSGWNTKALIKQIVMSQTYRRASHADPDQILRDRENRLLARGSRYRLDGEVIRDQILLTSGLLNPEMFGTSVKPPQPEGLWKVVAMPHSNPRIFKSDEGNKIYRRSLYTFWKRGLPPPQMTILNAPTREACIARRERTNTPLQALLLLNEKEYMKAARALAFKQLQASKDDQTRLNSLYEIITSRLPDQKETELFLKTVKDLKALYKADAKAAEELCSGISRPATITAADLASWTLLTNAIYNLDITKTRE